MRGRLLLQEFGDTEVPESLPAVGAPHNVLRLDVAVNVLRRGRHSAKATCFSHHPKSLQRTIPLRYDFTDGLPVNKFGRDKAEVSDSPTS